jgi:2-keto-4-pentenoate hydratase/2-oxohepta-3-ene-1,7-dioic acid hydratase in catechol pathway
VRVANLGGRAVLVTAADRGLDVGEASGGAFGPDPQSLFDDWAAFVAWTTTLPEGSVESIRSFRLEELGPPVPQPRQVFAIGINYAEHAQEAGYPPEAMPATFTKFASCLAGPLAEVVLPTDTVDWEVEAVAVIGKGGRAISREAAWDHVAGLMVGQDLSERTTQLAGAKPQFGLAKSYAGFGPTGPWLVTPDELPNRDDLAISCAVSGVTMQESRTSMLVYDVPELVARLSAVCELFPGDLIFTGTPAGVGNARDPKRFLTSNDNLTSTIEGIGTITQTFVDPLH